MIDLGKDARVVRAAGWLSAWVGQEHVMMSAESGNCVSLSESGGRIWELLEAPQTVGTLCGALAEEYDAGVETIRPEVEAFLDQLRSQGALNSAD